MCIANIFHLLYELHFRYNNQQELKCNVIWKGEEFSQSLLMSVSCKYSDSGRFTVYRVQLFATSSKVNSEYIIESYNIIMEL